MQIWKNKTKQKDNLADLQYMYFAVSQWFEISNHNFKKNASNGH